MGLPTLMKDALPLRTPRTRCNDLDGKTWLQFSISVWDDIRKSPEEQNIGHPAMFPAMLVERLLAMFTTREETFVLDPFVGSGSTLVAAKKNGKGGIGLDISPKFIRIAESRLRQGDLYSQGSTLSTKVIVADAKELLRYVKPNSADICITSPPYWNILTQKRTADYKAIRHYGNREGDLGTIEDYHEFIEALMGIFQKVHTCLKPSKYCIVVVMDLRKKGTFYPYHADFARMMQKVGFVFDDLIIWNRASEYNNLRPLGYPRVFRVNKVHEYILIFRKLSSTTA